MAHLPGGVLMTANIRPLRNAQDSRAWPLPLPPAEKQLRATRAEGFQEGEATGHVSGWRSGLLHGIGYGIVLGMVSMWALVQLGRLLGVD